MAIDIEERHSPGWWIHHLSEKLEERNEIIEPLYKRYEGDAEEPETLRHAPASAKRFFRISRVGFAEMIVKAVKYALSVQSIATTVDDSASGDSEAWKVFKASGMLHATDELFRDFLVAGRSYGIVHEHEGEQYFTAEDPRQVITEPHPFIPGKVLAAMKRYYDDVEGETVVRLWLEGRTYRAVVAGEKFAAQQAEWDSEDGGAEGVVLSGDAEIPVHELVSEDGVGEFQRHLDDLDRVDHLVLQGMTIATMQAFKQRAIKASPEDLPDEDPETGETIDYDSVFESDPGALWRLPATAEIWESGNIDLTPVWTGLDRAIQILSAVTFTPLAMFTPDGQNQSASGANLTRESRTMKVEDRQPRLAGPIERALAMIFRLRDAEDTRADASNITVIWKPAERYSLAEKADAMVKLKDVPWASRMIDVMQYSAGDVERMKRQRTDDMMTDLMAQMDNAPQRLGATSE